MRILIFGATGMIGSGVLEEALGNDDVTAVVAIGRPGAHAPDGHNDDDTGGTSLPGEGTSEPGNSPTSQARGTQRSWVRWAVLLGSIRATFIFNVLVAKASIGIKL